MTVSNEGVGAWLGGCAYWVGMGKPHCSHGASCLNGGVLLVWGQVRVGYRRLVRGKVFCAGGPPSEPVPQGRHTGCCVSFC